MNRKEFIQTLLQAEFRQLKAYELKPNPETAFHLVALWAQVEMLRASSRREKTHQETTRLLHSQSPVLQLAREYINPESVKDTLSNFLDTAGIHEQDIFTTLRTFKVVFDYMLVISAMMELDKGEESHAELRTTLEQWIMGEPQAFLSAGMWFANQFILYDPLLEDAHPHLEENRMLLDFMAEELCIDRGQWWGYSTEDVARIIATSDDEEHLDDK